MVPVLVGVVALALGVALGFVIRKAVARSQAESAEGRAQKVDPGSGARGRTPHARGPGRGEGRDRRAPARYRGGRSHPARRDQASGGTPDRRRSDSVDRKLDEAERRADELDDRDRKLALVREQLEHSATQHRAALEKIARLTASEAKEALRTQVVDEAKRDAMATVREIEQRAREEGEERARKIVTIAIQRVASEQTSESTVSVFSLPSDDMKGRIIGREGRNIRAFEATTGVNLIIDDTPEAVVLSLLRPRPARDRPAHAREAGRRTAGSTRRGSRRRYERSQQEIDEQIRARGRGGGARGRASPTCTPS